jgi:hypothetical protein
VEAIVEWRQAAALKTLPKEIELPVSWTARRQVLGVG